MKKRTYLRLFLISVTAALVLSLISFLCLIKFSDLAFREHRQGLLQFVARSIETNPKGLVLPPFPRFPPHGPRPMGPPPGPPPPGSPMGPPPGPPPDGGSFPEFWIVSESREVLSGDKEHPLPKALEALQNPPIIHGIATNDGVFSFFDRTTIMRLDHTPAAYLVLFERRNPFRGPLFITQGIFTFATVVIALLLSLTMTFFYLRRKSAEARFVLSRLERGDLKARFEIKPFDEFGGLLLDFNRMAHEIERLVSRLRETESARSNLLRELGHDLRTPLTSLTTSFETLKFHHDKMTEVDRRDIFSMITAEIEYFKELLEKLMTIAELDEPYYKKSTDVVDVHTLIEQEVRSRQNTQGTAISWRFTAAEAKNPTTQIPSAVLGDSYLLLRLLKNALDNAGRYARSEVQISLKENGEFIEIQVMDDGPGMDQESLHKFGRRQDRRKRREEGQGLNFSLGLGSVIMRSIVELHGGKLEVFNRSDENSSTDAFLQSGSGLILRFSIPKAAV